MTTRFEVVKGQFMNKVTGVKGGIGERWRVLFGIFLWFLYHKKYNIKAKIPNQLPKKLNYFLKQKVLSA